jgi:hypothetical protein
VVKGGTECLHLRVPDVFSVWRRRVRALLGHGGRGIRLGRGGWSFVHHDVFAVEYPLGIAMDGQLPASWPAAGMTISL